MHESDKLVTNSGQRGHGISLVINAGGASRRMGRDKALLRVPPTGTPLLCHIAQRLQSLPLDRLVVVSNSRAVRQAVAAHASTLPPVEFRSDAYPDAGALGGLATGVAACDDWAVVVACDMPLVEPALFRHLWMLAEKSSDAVDAVVPRVAGREQPFHALYHHRCTPLLAAQVLAGERRVRTVLTRLCVRYVSEADLRPFDPNLRSFVNVNTPADWARVLHDLI